MIVRITGADGVSRQFFDGVKSSVIEPAADGAFVARLTFLSGEIQHHPVTGPMFVMNDDGLTIDKFWPNGRQEKK